jgi:hypothetical protein
LDDRASSVSSERRRERAFRGAPAPGASPLKNRRIKSRQVSAVVAMGTMGSAN